MVGTIGLFLLMLVVTADVFLRDVFNQPIKGSIEIAELFQVLVVFFGLAYCEAHRGHVRAEVLIAYLGRRAQLALDAFTTLIALGLFALMVWYSTLNAIETWHSQELFEMMRIPVWPYRFIVPVGAFVFCLELLLRLWSDITGMTKGEDAS